jgi:hypothetical protein
MNSHRSEVCQIVRVVALKQSPVSSSHSGYANLPDIANINVANFDENLALKKEKYHYKTEDRFEYFEFYSEGPKGIKKKVVEFQKTMQEGVYNLAFGDYDEKAKGIDDLSVTNNGDSLKV